jgi:hypothetical protein
VVNEDSRPAQRELETRRYGTVSGVARLGLVILVLGFPLQFALRDAVALPPAVVLWSDLLVGSLLAMVLAERVLLLQRVDLGPILFVGALLLAGGVSGIINQAPWWPALSTFRLIVISPLVAALVMNLRATERYVTRLEGAILGTLALQALVSAWQDFASGFGNVDAAQGTFGANAANSLGDSFAIGFVVLYQRFLTGRSNGVEKVVALALSAGLVLTSSRLALGVVIGLCFILFLAQGKVSARRATLAAGLAATLGIGTFLFYRETPGAGLSLLSPTRELGVAETAHVGALAAPRLLIPAWTWSTMQETSPGSTWRTALIGLGPGTFGSYASARAPTMFADLIQEQFQTWGNIGTPGVYSEYVALFGEFGLVGLVIVLGMFGWTLKRSMAAFKSLRRTEWSPLAAGALAATLILIGRGFFANVLEDRIVGLYAWLAIGLSWRASRLVESEHAQAVIDAPLITG